ncbi:MAG: hypothetical protein IKR98_06045 [Bacteroidaceae bacterium]|nr:hypothetical protein [Bacteroidaceae bacterium]
MIEIPANRKNDLVFTHVSFQNIVVLYERYANGQQLSVSHLPMKGLESPQP